MRYLTIILTIICYNSYSQNEHYQQAFNDLKSMLEGETPISFKDAVFTSENAFYNNELDQKQYNMTISNISNIIELWLSNNKISDYSHPDSTNFAKNAAIFKVMTDTIYLTDDLILSTGFSYDFEDFFGAEDWRKQFVTKLINTNSGNCHSMPYLYKILADEVEAKAWLSLAPNHIYIKCRSKDPQISFYNTELTSKCFPIDAWLMASSGITTETIISGIWMEALDDKKSVALCVLDLAHGHKNREVNYNKEFIIECCDLALTHYPNFANALLLKGDMYREMYVANPSPETLELMNQVYTKLHDLGYRDVPKGTYLEWLEELAKNMDQYNNKNLNLK